MQDFSITIYCGSVGSASDANRAYVTPIIVDNVIADKELTVWDSFLYCFCVLQFMGTFSRRDFQHGCPATHDVPSQGNMQRSRCCSVASDTHGFF